MPIQRRIRAETPDPPNLGRLADGNAPDARARRRRARVPRGRRPADARRGRGIPRRGAARAPPRLAAALVCLAPPDRAAQRALPGDLPRPPRLRLDGRARRQLLEGRAGRRRPRPSRRPRARAGPPRRPRLGRLHRLPAMPRRPRALLALRRRRDRPSLGPARARRRRGPEAGPPARLHGVDRLSAPRPPGRPARSRLHPDGLPGQLRRSRPDLERGRARRLRLAVGRAGPRQGLRLPLPKLPDPRAARDRLRVVLRPDPPPALRAVRRRRRPGHPPRSAGRSRGERAADADGGRSRRRPLAARGGAWVPGRADARPLRRARRASTPRAAGPRRSAAA